MPRPLYMGRAVAGSARVLLHGQPPAP